MFSLLRESETILQFKVKIASVVRIVFFYLFYFPFIFQFDNCKLLFHLSNHDGHDQIKSALAKVLDYNMVYSQGLPNDKKVG